MEKQQESKSFLKHQLRLTNLLFSLSQKDIENKLVEELGSNGFLFILEKHSNSGKSKGKANFYTNDDAIADALLNLNQTKFEGRPLNVTKSNVVKSQERSQSQRRPSTANPNAIGFQSNRIQEARRAPGQVKTPNLNRKPLEQAQKVQKTLEQQITPQMVMYIQQISKTLFSLPPPYLFILKNIEPKAQQNALKFGLSELMGMSDFTVRRLINQRTRKNFPVISVHTYDLDVAHEILNIHNQKFFDQRIYVDLQTRKYGPVNPPDAKQVWRSPETEEVKKTPGKEEYKKAPVKKSIKKAPVKVEVRKAVARPIEVPKNSCCICKKIKTPDTLWELGCSHSLCSDLDCLGDFANDQTDPENVLCQFCGAPIPKSLINEAIGGTGSIYALNNFTCNICYQPAVTEESETLECGHKFHKECIAETIQYLIQQRQISASQFVWPENDWNVTFSERILRKICSETDLNQYFDFLLQDASINVQGQKRVNCPCGKFFLVPQEEKFGSCGYCFQPLCYKCEKSHRKGDPWNLEKLLEEEKYIRNNMDAKNCPKCKQLVTKIAGCNFMYWDSVKCTGQTYFWYLCEAILTEDVHWSHFGPSQNPFGSECYNTIKKKEDPQKPEEVCPICKKSMLNRSKKHFPCKHYYHTKWYEDYRGPKYKDSTGQWRREKKTVCLHQECVSQRLNAAPRNREILGLFRPRLD